MKKCFSLRDYESFVYLMLCKRKNRHKLIRIWNSHVPFKDNCIVNVFKSFLNCVLYNRMRFTITNTSVSFFGDKLQIPLIYLSGDEKNVIHCMHQQKDMLFKSVKSLEAECFVLDRFIYDGKYTFPIKNRREIARDFIFMLYMTKIPRTTYNLIVTAQLMMVEKLKTTDRFIYELHHILQKDDRNIKNLLTHY